MKNLLRSALALLLASQMAFAGKIQNEDVKTLTQIQAAGGTAAQLINDTKIYVTGAGLNKQLSAAISAGDIGGGGGSSGKNFLSNASFDNTPVANSWTTQFGTFTADTVAYTDGTQSIRATLSGSTGLLTQNVTPGPDLSGLSIQASCYIKTTLPGVQLCAMVGGTEASCQPAGAAGSWTLVTAYAVGPTQGTSIGVRVKSASATGTYNADQCYVGKVTGVGQVSQTSVVGSVNFPKQTCPTATPTSIGAGSFTDFTGGDCPSVVASGGVTVASGTLNFTAANLPAGEYEAYYSGMIGCSTADVVAQLSDGTDSGGSTVIATAAGGHINYLSSHFSYSSGGTKTFRVQQKSLTGVCSTTVNADTSAQFVLVRYPTASQTITQNTGQAASWSGAISGATYSTSSATLVDPTVSGTPVLTQYQNTNFGSVSLAPSGLGLSFTVPTYGAYEFCYGSSISVVGGIATLRLVDGAVTKLTEIGVAPLASQSVTTGMQCGYLNATSLSNTLKIQVANSASSLTTVGADSNVVNFTIKQLDAGRGAVAFPGSISSPAAGQKKVISARVSQCTTDPCTIVAGGEGVSVINRSGAGQYTATLSSGFSGAPDHCSYSSYDGAGSAVAVGNGLPTSGSIGINTFTASTNTAVDTSLGFSFSCIGPK